jgi:opacity protein-like surface antigen
MKFIMSAAMNTIMRKLHIVATAAIVLVASASAFAADVKLVRKAPPRPIPVFSWAGPYAGVALGWTRAKSRSRVFDDPPCEPTDPTCSPPPTTPPTSPNIPGGLPIVKLNPSCGDIQSEITRLIASGRMVSQTLDVASADCIDPIRPAVLAGYNFELGNKLIGGLEADFGWIGGRSDGRLIIMPDGSSIFDQYKVTWNAHARGRLGYAINQCVPGFIGQCLPYIAAGLALVGFEPTHINSNAAGVATVYGANDTRAGYTIGAGLEIADLAPSILRGWSFRAEYLYDHFSSKQYDWIPGLRFSVYDLSLFTWRAAAIYHF